MSRADRHIDHADLVLDLPDHDAGFARVCGHPVQDAGRRAHGIGTIEFHSCRRTSHGHRNIAAQDCVPVLRLGKGIRERCEVRSGVVVTGARNADVFGHNGLAFFLELLSEDVLQRREADAHHVQASADRECVLRNLIAGDIGQLGNRKRAELRAGSSGAGLDRVGIEDTRGTGSEQLQVAIHAVLVKRNEQVDSVTHVGDLIRTRANGQKRVAAANDGLIGVVGIQVKTTPAEDFRENVARRGHTLPSCASDTDSKGLLHHPLTS